MANSRRQEILDRIPSLGLTPAAPLPSSPRTDTLLLLPPAADYLTLDTSLAPPRGRNIPRLRKPQAAVKAMDTLPRYELLYEVTRRFYLEGQSKTAIGAQLGLSSTHIARLIEEARDLGFVSIQYHWPRMSKPAFELKQKYPFLREVIVIATSVDYAPQQGALAEQASLYFEERVNPGAKVGLSGGQTVFEMIKALPERSREIQIVPSAVLARGDRVVRHIDPIVSVTLLWAKSGLKEGALSFLTVTPLERTKRRLALKDVRNYINELSRLGRVERMCKSMAEVDFLFASVREIGSQSDDPEMGAMAIDLLSDIGITARDLKGAVADINYSFIDAEGNSRSDWRLFLSLHSEDLRRMAADPGKRIVVTAGDRKHEALRAALRGKLFNVLITNERTAVALLDR